MDGGAFFLVAFFKDLFDVGMNVLFLNTLLFSVPLLAALMHVQMLSCGFRMKGS